VVNQIEDDCGCQVDSQVDPVGNYLRLAAQRYKPLTKEEEIAAYEAGDHEALVNSQLLWVINLAKKVSHRTGYKDIEALISSANLALARSVKSFNPYKARLTTYVSRLVRWECYDTANETGVGPSIGQMQRRPNLRPAVLWGDDPPVGKPDESEWNQPEQAAMNSEGLERIREAMASIPQKHADVIRMRFLEQKTLKETGAELGISKERVRQIEATATNHLRRTLRTA